jgi:hypothetical protein
MRPILILMLVMATIAMLLPATMQAAPCDCQGTCPIDIHVPRETARPIASLTVGPARGSVAVVGTVAAIAAAPVKAAAKLGKAIRNRERKPVIHAVAAVGKKAGRLICHRRGG